VRGTVRESNSAIERERLKECVRGRDNEGETSLEKFRSEFFFVANSFPRK